MSNNNFFAHNRLFDDTRHYARWTLWRWATAEDQNPTEVSLNRCSDQSVAECWQQWFARRPNPRISQADLKAAVADVRRAIQFERTSRLQVHPRSDRGDIYWPGIGVIDHHSDVDSIV